MASPDDIARSIRGPVPFWFINGPLKRENVARELELMRQQGIREVIVHPRYGLTVPYLSDQWFEIFGWCVEEARKRRMFIWIYDEFNWPSGTAGMSVQEIDPLYMSKYLAVEATPRAEIDLKRFEPGQFLVAARVQGGKVTKTRVLETVDAIGLLEGNWMIFNCRIKRDKFYIDTLNPAAVECFRRLTYDEYYRRFSREFGRTIRAVFTDEPSIYWVSVGYDDMNLPYTERLLPSFEERFGYSAVPCIPYLFYPGGNAAEFRSHFWRHVSDLFNTNYHGTLGSWCRQHGVIYTGHGHHEEPLRYQIRFTGDLFGTMRQMDLPGIDHLDKDTLGNRWISIIGHKIASSSAHFAGKPRVMSESFGVMGWDATFADLKKVVDWQLGLGINLIVPHALFHTTAGKAKRESPPSFFFQSPLWEDFGWFTDYLNRLTDMLTGGRHECKILVFYPLSGLHSAYQTDRKTQEFEHIESFLDTLCLELVKRQLDYDLADAAALAAAEVSRGRIRIGQESYEIFIIPATPYLAPEERRIIERIARAGVQTYLFHRAVESSPANLPRSEAGINFELTEWMAGFVGRLRESIRDEVMISGAGSEDILALRRRKGGKRVTFLVNRADKPRDVALALTTSSQITVMKPEDGSRSPLRTREDGTAHLRFAAHQSFILIAGETPPPEEDCPTGRARELPLSDLRIYPLRNAASIYRFGYSGEAGREEIDLRDAPTYFPANWDPNPPDFSQFAGEYTAAFVLNSSPECIEMVVDSEYAAYHVYLNGKRVDLEPDGTWLVDVSDLSAKVGRFLKQGRNEIKVLADTRLSEPVRFTGDFDVSIKDGLVTIEPTGALREHFRLEKALPFYSGTVTYRAGFDLSGSPRKIVLQLGQVHDAASVIVNGQPAGKRLWAPWEMDITSFVRPGENDVEIAVRNTPANIMLGEPRPLGLREQPVLKVWD